MRAVGIRDLKNRLSEYLRLVREGETVLVTDRGRVVAQLAPPPHLALPTVSEDDALARLAAAGKVRLAARRVPSPGAGPVLDDPGLDASAALAALREDRFGE